MRFITLVAVACCVAAFTNPLGNIAHMSDALRTPSVPTKTPLWQYTYTQPEASTNPTTHKDVVYVPTNTTLRAFNSRTGSLLWVFDYYTRGDNSEGNSGGYAAADEKLVVLGTHNRVYALNPADGSLLWSTPAPSGTRPNGYDGMRPTIGESGIFVTTGYTPLLKLKKENGQVGFRATSASGIAQLHATEAKDGLGIVYFVSEVNKTSSLVALDAKEGREIHWSRAGFVTIIVSDATRLVFAQGSGSNGVGSAVAAFTFETGALKYSLNYADSPAIDYYLLKKVLYVDAAPSGSSPANTNITYYDVDTLTNTNTAPLWMLRGVSFLYFIPCEKGIVNYGSEFVSAFSKSDGALLWQYAGIAVNDGAATDDDVIISVFADRVVALEF